MTPEYLQLGATAIVAIVAFKAIEKIIEILSPKKTDNEVTERVIALEKTMAVIADRLDKIENNHLRHIQADLAKNVEDHTEIKVAIARLETKIDDLRK